MKLRNAGRSILIACFGAAAVIASIEIILAWAGVTPMRYEEDPYVGFTMGTPLFVPEPRENGSETPFLKTAPGKLTYFNDQRFARNKAPGTYRIFCMGGSTTYGRPYNHRAAFSAWLQAFLKEAAPNQSWEVINAGGISYASYRVALLMEELIQYDPDLFIVYSGHNEFLELRTYKNIIETPRPLLEAGAALRQLRSYAVFRRARQRQGIDNPDADASRTVLPSEVTAILDHAHGPWAYERDDALRENALEHYRYNLGRMADIASSANAEVIYVTTPANLLDCKPFKSTHAEGLSPEDTAAWEKHINVADNALNRGDKAAALEAYDQAAALDPRHARTHYERGRLLYELGRYAAAKTALVRALDEDVCPLRALAVMHDIVRAVARERGAPLIDLEAWAEAQSPHGITDATLFRDHVHPNIDTHRALARMIFDQIAASGVVQTPKPWTPGQLAFVGGSPQPTTQTLTLTCRGW